MLAPLRVIRVRAKLFGCLAFGALAGLLTPSDWQATARCLVGWDVAIVAYFILVSRFMAAADEAGMRRHAQELDEGRLAILVSAIAAATISFGAIVAELSVGKDLGGVAKAAHIGLAVGTIVLSWFFLHLMFALHYANEYYLEFDFDGDGSPELRGGLHFPGDCSPAYVDFLYYSFTVGVAAQTADVETTSRSMRAITLTQSILAFFFNTAILALTINIAAGLL